MEKGEFQKGTKKAAHRGESPQFGRRNRSGVLGGSETKGRDDAVVEKKRQFCESNGTSGGCQDKGGSKTQQR